jgi:hypothetical protein
MFIYKEMGQSRRGTGTAGAPTTTMGRRQDVSGTCYEDMYEKKLNTPKVL